jgi:hypothetical protein
VKERFSEAQILDFLREAALARADRISNGCAGKRPARRGRGKKRAPVM